ncbi:hypothetical protein TVAG_352760 [Trichomonas vaginalis G3]|uniref:Tyr recombinase domain-containing protein n=2 Tax=Trichomonas vaginalis (strain ATCC PRA-98 / G3) TaxID=412133 RepID=A2EG78_TRIV3|nr:hypothetical protein TVAG_352760 [Trichomonas vaginalis G3]|eukprot:XP_001320577.1 hypothetical protein [Trichomonas vaginalis G3]
MRQFAAYSNAHPENLSIMTLISLLYHGFLRISEALALTGKDIQVIPTRIEITINLSKTNQYGEHEVVYVCNGDQTYHPRIWLAKFKEKNNILGTDNKLFLWSQSNARIILAQFFDKNKIDPTKYSTHSFRKGAANAAALAKISDSKIKTMGR